MPLILISNDDGITMEGIHRLVDAVSELGTVIVAAPDGPRSGGSSAISCNTMLMPKRIDDYNGAQMWSVNGTPADCVKGCLQGIPSIGFSVCTHNPSASDFDACMPHVTEITRRVIERRLPDGVCLNVNFPKGGVVKGFRRARACRGRWTEEYAHYTSPEGKPFYILTGKYENHEPEATDTDLYWNAQGYGSVVPVTPDLDYSGTLDIMNE